MSARDYECFLFCWKGGKTMATIRTSIMVHDGMSMALRHMNSAVQSVVSSFEQMHAATNQSIDTRQFASAQKDIALATKALDQFEMEVQQAGAEQARTNKQLNDGASMFNKISGAIIGAVGAYVSLRQVANLVNFATEYSNTTARIAMMNDGLQTTAELQQKIYQAAQNSLSSYDATAQMVAKLGNNAASAFSSASEIVDFAELVQKQFGIAGASAIEASNASLQLTQALGSGVLRGDELNSIFEQAPNLIQNIASYLDVPIGKIREMASEGKITAQIVKESMFAAADDINEKFGAMPLTWSDIWNNMVNYAQNRAAGLAQRLSDLFNSDTFAFFQMAATKAIDMVVMGIHVLIMLFSSLANWVAIVGQFFVDNWSWIAPILIPIATALGVILTILIAKYTWLALVTLATHAWTAAQWAYNAAALANPTTWIIIAIIAVIALAIYALYAWGDATAIVIGYTVALFAGLGAFIANLIINIANILTMFAEFFINLFIDPTYAVKKLFYDMVMFVVDNMGAMAGSFDSAATALGNAFVAGANIAISAINAVISALNVIPGIEIGTIGKLASGSSNVFTKQWKSFASNLKAPTSDKAVVSLQRTQLMNIPEAYNKGFDWGYSGSMAVTDAMHGLVDKAKGYINYDFGAGNGMDKSLLGDLLNGYGLGKDDYLGGLNDALNGLGDAIKDGNGAAKDTAANTGKLADAAKLSQEDLKYLRDQAASDSDNRYHNTIVKIDMRNENHINNDMDIDGIVEQLAVKTEEALGTLGEGG